MIGSLTDLQFFILFSKLPAKALGLRLLLLLGFRQRKNLGANRLKLSLALFIQLPLLFFAARCEHAEKVIKPALERGAWVLSDRFTDATYAYQTGGKGMKGEDVEALEAWTLAGFAPDVTVLFDLAPEVAARRRTIRAGEGDRFERESADFFARVRNAYLDRAARDPKRFVRVNAEEAPETIAAQLEKEFAKWL